MTRFDGKVALVSGAAGAIGSAVVTRLADEGAEAVACDVSTAGLDDGVACDVRDANSCRAAVDVAASGTGSSTCSSTSRASWPATGSRTSPPRSGGASST